MQKHQKIGFAMMVIGAIAPIAIEYVSYKIRMAKTLTEIEAETQAELNAIAQSRKTMEKLIRSGQYEGRTFTDVERDLNFYRIVARFKD